jgi:hypothetical protein
MAFDILASASGSGGRADCSNDGPMCFSMLGGFSSGGCGNIFENLERPRPGVLGMEEDIFSIGPAAGLLRDTLRSLRSMLKSSIDSVVAGAMAMADHFGCLKENVSWAPSSC